MQINAINNNYNSVRSNKNSLKNASPTFCGKDPNKLVKGIANVLKKFNENDTYQKGIKKFSNFDDSFTHLMALESTILASFYIFCTLKNDKIEKEQKPQMVINEGLTLGFSTAGAYLIDGRIRKWVGNKSEEYLKNHKDFYLKLGKENLEKKKENPLQDLLNKADKTSKQTGNAKEVGLVETENLIDNHLQNIVGKKSYQFSEKEFDTFKSSVIDTIKNPKTTDVKKSIEKLAKKYYDSSIARSEADKFMSGIGKLRVILIVGLLYRFAGPVLFTPIANKLSSRFFPSKAEQAKMKEAK